MVYFLYVSLGPENPQLFLTTFKITLFFFFGRTLTVDTECDLDHTKCVEIWITCGQPTVRLRLCIRPGKRTVIFITLFGVFTKKS